MNKDRLENSAVAVPDPAGRGDLGLLDIWNLLQRRKGLLVFGIAAGLALSAMHYYRATPIYK